MTSQQVTEKFYELQALLDHADCAPACNRVRFGPHANCNCWKAVAEQTVSELWRFYSPIKEAHAN